MSTSNITYRIDMRDIDGNAGVWTNVTGDVLAPKGMSWQGGMPDLLPTTRLAAGGWLQLYLNNAAGPGGNSGNKQGYYSASHANRRTGFFYGTPIRVVATLDGIDYPQWAGWIDKIQVRTGRYREQYTFIHARDVMDVLADTDVNAIAPQLGQTEVQLIIAVFASLPSGSQPLATSYDAALDTLQYAFYDSSPPVKAFTLLDKAVKSSQGMLFSMGDGTVKYLNRHTIGLRTSQATFNDEMHDLDVPVGLDGVFNRVRTRIAPPRVDAASTTEIAKTLSRILVPANQSVSIFVDYQDPTNTLRTIGATAFVDGSGASITPLVNTALVASDITGTANQDGSGADLSASITASVTCFATSAKFTFSNSNMALDAWCTGRVRGKGIYDDTEQIFESYTAQTYGDRPLDVDLHYQGDGNIARAYGEYLYMLSSGLTKQGGIFTLVPRETAAKALQGVSRGIGDIITVQETVSGVTADFMIVAVGCGVAEGPWPIYKWLLIPTFGSVFIFDDATNGKFDTGRFGYA